MSSAVKPASLLCVPAAGHEIARLLDRKSDTFRGTVSAKMGRRRSGHRNCVKVQLPYLTVAHVSS